MFIRGSARADPLEADRALGSALADPPEADAFGETAWKLDRKTGSLPTVLSVR